MWINNHVAIHNVPDGNYSNFIFFLNWSIELTELDILFWLRVLFMAGVQELYYSFIFFWKD